MSFYDELLAHCHVNTIDDFDSFVGIKADSEKAIVNFPIGYQLPKSEQELRMDILHLISVLNELTERMDNLFAMQKYDTPQEVEFPIRAYMEIISSFMEQNGYYTEKVSEFKVGKLGKIDWARTLRNKKPIIQANGTPAFVDYVIRVSAPNERNMITQIHKFCVYESFKKLGWLFTPFLPDEPTIHRNEKMFLIALRNKLANTNLDKDKRLFTAMISMLEYIDEKTMEKQFYFGTNRFEYVWEKLIDRAFGVKNKVEYFPKTRWALREGRNRTNAALEPDTIMLHSRKIYVIDAKYYKFGETGIPSDLPESSSINKQITYGEYIASLQRFKNVYGEDVPVYNAFVMPYNSRENHIGVNEIFVNIGEATGDWKTSGKTYERVQGILVDTRYLMHHYVGSQDNRIMMLAQSISSAFNATGGVLPTGPAPNDATV